MELKVTVRVPGETPRDYSVGPVPMVFGRDPACEGFIPSQYVSRQQFRIEWTGTGWRLADLGGRNLVTVNGVPLQGESTFRPGDVISVANVTVETAEGSAARDTVAFPAPVAAPVRSPGEVLAGLPGGSGATLSIMFTDLERSTSLVTNLGEREGYRVLQAHNRILRAQFQAFRGHEAKRVGDGFLVLFTSAREAVHCAIAIQRTLHAPAEGLDQPILVRVGLHIGEVTWDENDIFGAAVNYAARVSAEAHGGEILVSPLMREVIAPSGEFVFGEERMLPLKGFRGLHVLTAVTWAGE